MMIKKDQMTAAETHFVGKETKVVVFHVTMTINTVCPAVLYQPKML